MKAYEIMAVLFSLSTEWDCSKSCDTLKGVIDWVIDASIVVARFDSNSPQSKHHLLRHQ